MNIQKNARLTRVRRMEMVQDITLRGRTVAQAATAHCVSEMTDRVHRRAGAGAGAADRAAGQAGRAVLVGRGAGPKKALEPARELAALPGAGLVQLGAAVSAVRHRGARALGLVAVRPQRHRADLGRRHQRCLDAPGAVEPGHLGLATGVAGVALLVGFDPASLGPGAPVVTVLGLGAAFCYRIATFYAKTAKQQTG